MFHAFLDQRIRGKLGASGICHAFFPVFVPQRQYAAIGNVDFSLCFMVHIYPHLKHIYDILAYFYRFFPGCIIDGLDIAGSLIGMVNVEKFMVLPELLLQLPSLFLKYFLRPGIPGDYRHRIEAAKKRRFIPFLPVPHLQVQRCQKPNCQNCRQHICRGSKTPVPASPTLM